MSFVSYAQNFEDVMLWRALKHIQNGFYIDIGAQDPIVDSVSLAFYEHGWRGVHVEPTLQYSSKLRKSRPDETVLQVVIGNAADRLTLYEFENTGLSTCDPEVAKKHEESGFSFIKTTVDVISLDSLFDQIENKHVHWLKLDVEGLEKSVLESWKDSSIYPWILVIESTEPRSQSESYAEWEQIVLDKGYHFVYFDGLNRFYVSSEHYNLKSAFSSPPNVFDGFMLSGCGTHTFYKIVESKAQQAEAKAQQAKANAQKAKANAQKAESKAQQAESKAQQAESRALEALSKAQEAKNCVTAIYASSSWRVTAPLRWVGFQTLLLRQHGIIMRIKMLIRKILRKTMLRASTFILLHPKIRSYCEKALVSIGLYNKVLIFYKRLLATSSSINFYTEKPPLELQHLTQRARAIYELLKKDIENK